MNGIINEEERKRREREFDSMFMNSHDISVSEINQTLPKNNLNKIGSDEYNKRAEEFDLMFGNAIDMQFKEDRQFREEMEKNKQNELNQTKESAIDKAIVENIINNKENDKANEIDDVLTKEQQYNKNRADVIVRGNKLDSLKTAEEKQQEEQTKLEQQEYNKMSNSDKGLFSQLGKLAETIWLSFTSGGKRVAKTATDVEYNKNQEASLLAGNNKNVSDIVEQNYINQEFGTPIENKAVKNIENENYSLFRFTPGYEKFQNKTSKKISQETQNKINQDVNSYKNAYGEIDLNPLQLELEKSINEDTQKINTNINEISNPVIKKVAELTPSTVNSLIGAGLSHVNPLLGLSYFTTSAMSSYEDNGRQMGMTKKQAKAYSKVMGIMESVTEMIGIDKFLSAGKALKNGMFKQALKDYGLNMADNAIQEAIIDPIDEGIAYLSSGKNKNNYSTIEGGRQLISDMLKDGFDGALSALLMDGVGAGINSAVNVYDKIMNDQKISNNELKSAFEDINNDNRININESFSKTYNFEKNKLINGETGNYIVLDFDNDGNIISLTESKGKPIKYNGDMNISPTIVFLNDNYNVIDSRTGLKLDTTPYQTVKEAEKGFNNYAKSITDSAIREVNNRINKAKISIINTLNEFDINENTGINNTKMYDKDLTINLLKEYGVDTNNIQNRQYLGREINDMIEQQNERKQSYIPDTDNLQSNPINNIPESLDSRFGKSETNNYAIPDIDKVKNSFGTYKTYSKEEVADIWNKIESNNYDAYFDNNGNIQSYIAMEEEGNNIVVNQYDSNDNIIKSEIIPSKMNNLYTSEDIKNTIEKVSKIYDETRPIKGQIDIEGNEVRSMKKKSNKKSKNIVQEDASKKLHDKIQNAINNKNSKGRTNLGTVSIKTANKIAKVTGINVSERNHILLDNDIRHMLNQHGDGIKEEKKGQIAITSKDIEQIPNIINNYDKIIKGSVNTKNQQTVRYIKKINNNKNYVVEVIPNNKNNLIIKTMWIKPIRVINGQQTPNLTSKTKPNNGKSTSINSSITQKNKSVKSNTDTNTTINKQSMQDNKNNTQKTIKSLEDIKVKYKSQTEQLNIFENKDNTISINNIIVKQSLRNKGIGQNILNDIIDYADKNNKTLTLTPTNEYLTRKRLTNWYKKNGFVENKSRNTDFSISDTMYRRPKTSRNNKKNNTIDNLMQIIISNERNSFKSNIKINTKVVDEASEIPLNYKKARQSALSNLAKKLFRNLHKRILNNKSEKIYVTNSDINESIAQTLKNPNQKAILKDNIAVFSQLDKIIENAIEIKSSDTEIIDNKSITQYKDYKYYYTQTYIDGEQTWVQFDTRLQKGTTGKDERHFRLERIYKINEASSNGDTGNTPIIHFSNELTSTSSISQNNQNVKDDNIRTMKKNTPRNNTMQTNTAVDNQGRILTKLQQEYFKDSKVRDEKGNLLTVYHGTNKNFTEFKNKYIQHGRAIIDGYYLTPDRTNASEYGNNIMELYVNIKNPLYLHNYNGITRELINRGYANNTDELISKYNLETDDSGVVPTARSLTKLVKKLGYDGIITTTQNKDVIDTKWSATQIVALNSNQIKNIDNINPSTDKDIRFAKKSAKTVKTEEEILEPGQTNAQRENNYIEQEIRKIESSGNWDDSIPVTRMTDIKNMIEDYLGIGVQKSHFRQQAYGIYKSNRDVIRTKELKDIDTILHETGHALDMGKRISINKDSISNELLKAVENYGGYEAETREVQLEEGFAEVIREYTIVPERAKIDYPQTVAVLEGIRQENKSFNDFITKIQRQTYNYIHQNPRNRTLSNISIGEKTNKKRLSKEWIKQEVIRNIYDKDYATKEAVNTLAKMQRKNSNNIKASENAYYLVRLSSGIGDKVTSMLSNGYIDEKGNKLMPGLNQIGEILGNNSERYNDLRAYLVAQRDMEYKAKTLKTGLRTMDSKAVIEQFKNDIQIKEAAKIVYDTLDGVLQYAVNNNLITKETADSLKESNTFYVPMQRVLEGNKNNIGRRGAVSDIIKKRTGSELDVKDVLENIITNSSNIIQQVENNNILKALYKEGEKAGLTGSIYDVIPTPMIKVGTAKLSTWENELKNQGVNINNIDFEKTIDLFAPNNKIDSQNLITSFINDIGKRVYLQFNDEILFNSLMNMDKKFMSSILNLNRKLNMPLRYGATMANIGFAIPNAISDTAQAAIFSEAGFIPVVDNIIGIMDIISAQNRSARNFFNKIIPGYADKINTLYAIYEQSGATNSTRLSQYRETSQNIMKNVYGTKNNEVLGIEEKYKPLKKLLDILTYIPELSEQSTRFRVFEKNLEYYRKNGLSETDARIEAALQSRDATQDFSRTGNVTREINQLIPFSAARVGSAYTFAEKVKANPKRVVTRTAILVTIGMIIKAMGYDDKEIEELNQRKKDDNFVLKIGEQVVTIKKPQGILRSIINLGEYIQDLFTGHIEEGKESERLVEWTKNAIMDNMPADSITGLVPNMIAPVVENAINKDLYYNSDIVKSYDLELPDSEQYYDYNSQVAIWLGKVFNYSPAKIDNLISGYFAGLGTSVTNVIDWIVGKTGIASEQPEMGAEDNAVAKRFIVNVNSNSASIDEIYNLKTDLTKKKNGGTITTEESKQLETITEAISEISKLNKQIREVKADSNMSGKDKAEEIKLLQNQKTDTARKALGKEVIYSENEDKIKNTKLYPSSDTLRKNGYTLTMDSNMKKEYEEVANNYYQKYESQGIYSEKKLESIQENAKDYAKDYIMKKYKNKLEK